MLRGRARLASLCGGSRRGVSSSATRDRWQLGTLAVEVVCTPCVVTAPWGAARKGGAFDGEAPPSRPAAGTAFVCHTGLEPRTSRAQADLTLTRVSLALDRPMRAAL